MKAYKVMYHDGSPYAYGDEQYEYGVTYHCENPYFFFYTYDDALAMLNTLAFYQEYFKIVMCEIEDPFTAQWVLAKPTRDRVDRFWQNCNHPDVKIVKDMHISNVYIMHVNGYIFDVCRPPVGSVFSHTFTMKGN